MRLHSTLLGTVIAWLGSGVGGGTHVWAKTLVRADPEVLRRVLPAEIRPEALAERYYPLVERMLGAVAFPDYPPYAAVPKTRVMQQIGAAMERDAPGAASYPLPLAIRFARPGQAMGDDIVTEFGTPRRTYDLGDDALLSGDWGTTNTTDSNYLAKALLTGNVKILALHQADRIDEIPGGGYRIRARRLEGEESSGGGSREPSFSARELFLGAGSLGTCEILLRNARLHQTLARLSPRLGARYGTNGDRLGLAAMARLGQPDLGPTNSWAVEFPDVAGRPEILIIDGGYPHPFVMAVLAVLDALGVRGPRITSGLIRGQRWIQKNITRRLAILSPLPLLGMNADNRMEGQMSLDRKGRLVLDVELADNAEPDRKMDARMAQMADVVAPTGAVRRAINRFFVRLPSRLYRMLGKTEVPHNLGGAPMGATAAEGVVNHVGAVHGYRGLYLVDASVLPPAIGRNPVATIAALAERSMAHALLAHHRQILTERLERLLAGLAGDAAPEALRAEVARRVEKEQERVLGGPAVADAPADLWATLLTSVHARAGGQLDRPDDPPATGQQLLRELLDTVAALDPDEIARG
jgi:cholesterol oxidase